MTKRTLALALYPTSMANIRLQDDAGVTDETVLWRYIDVPKFLDMLTTNSLKFPLAIAMEDPYEGDVGAATVLKQWEDLKEQKAPSYMRVMYQDRDLAIAEKLRASTYLSCWNAIDQESAAMWKLFGDDRGVAIRTTWKSLRDSLTPAIDLFAGRVTYLDYDRNPIPSDSYTDDYFYKRSSFSHENEFRLIGHAKDAPDYLRGKIDSPTWPKVETVPCDLRAMIEEVYVNPTVSTWVAEAVRSVSEKYDFSWPVTHSRLYTRRNSDYWPKHPKR